MNIGAAVMALVSILCLVRYVVQHFRLYESSRKR